MLKCEQSGKTAFKLAAENKRFGTLAAMFSPDTFHSSRTMEILNDGTLNEVCERGGTEAVLNMLNEAKRQDDINKESSCLAGYLCKTDRDRRTLLHIACSRGDQDLVMAILMHIQNIAPESQQEVLCFHDSMGQTALHESCRLQNLDILQSLMDCALKVKWRYASEFECARKLLCGLNKKGRTALFEVFENGDTAKVKLLLHYSLIAKHLRKVLARLTKKRQTIFHHAMQHGYNHIRTFDVVVSHIPVKEPDMQITKFLEWKDALNKTPFHYMSQASDEITAIFMKLDENGTVLHRFLTEQDDNRQTILHRACITGESSALHAIYNCIKFLKPEDKSHPWDKVKFDEILLAQDKDGKTPLHHICEQGSSNNFKTLLEIARIHEPDEGCFVEMVRIKDNSNKTCLYFLQHADKELLEALMKEITISDIKLTEQKGSTYVPGETYPKSSDIPLSTRQKSEHHQMHADTLGQLLTYQLLTDKDDDGRTPLSYAGDRQKVACTGFLTPFYNLLKQKIQKGDKEINLDSKEGRKKVIEETSLSDYILFQTLIRTGSYSKKTANSLLSTLGELNCLAIINHEYVQSYLIKCWRSYGRYFFFSNFFLYFTLVLLLTSFVISHQEVPDKHLSNITSNLTNGSGTSDITTTGSDEPSYKQKMISTLPYAHEVSILIFITSVGLLTWEGLQFCAKRMDYWRSLENWADIVICIGPLVLTIACWINGYRSWNHVQWTALVTLAWFKMAWLMTKIPKYTSRYLQLIGRKFLMLFKVMENVVKFLPVLILFTGIFAVAFYCLFSRDDEFNQFEYSILKTITLAIGEFEFRDLFLESETQKYHYIPGCILVLILFVVMTISAMNLLVAIAVGECKELKEKSESVAFLILVDQIFECQEIMRLFPGQIPAGCSKVKQHIECCFSNVEGFIAKYLLTCRGKASKNEAFSTVMQIICMALIILCIILVFVIPFFIV